MLKRAFNGFHGSFTYLQPFKLSIFYSTSARPKHGVSNPPPMLEFLTKSIGFSEKEAASIITKVSYFSKCTTKQPDMVVNFLKTSGFDDNHLKRLLTSVPSILRYNIDKTLEPKIRTLRELGLSGSDLGLLISRFPQLLVVSLEAHIIPSLEMLKSVVGSDQELVNLLLNTKSQKLLSGNLLKHLPQNLQLLQSYGISKEKIKHLILTRPLVFILNTQWLEERVKLVDEMLRIPRDSAVFLRAVSALSMINEHKLESLFQVFRSYNWSEASIIELIKAQPFTVGISEKSLRGKLKYFNEDLGYGPDYLVARPALLGYSMEKRIVPRTAVIQALKEKQLLKKNICHYSFICYAEPKFVKRFVVKFKDELPQLYEYYMKQTSALSGLSLSKSKNTLLRNV